MTEPRNGKIVTFYSYKGGTGRSMLLANVAWILASHRKRVLMVDWDLEAPGLHRYFHPFIPDKYLAATPGLVEWVLDYQTAVAALDLDTKEVPADLLEHHADLTPYLISIDCSELAKGAVGALHLMSAGCQDSGYPRRFNDLDFRGLYSGLDGLRFFERVKQKMKADYDYVLIDSRTGVGDTASICTLQMPDTLVVCFTLNSQSTVGASSVAKAVFADRKLSAAKDATGKQTELDILPVPTRIERSEKQKLERARRRAYKAFENFPTGLEGRDLERYWRSVEVPYEAFYAYEEVLAVFADQPGDITSVLASAERLTRYVAGPDFQELVRMPDERRELALGKYSEADDKTFSAAERAERVYSGLSPDQEKAARELFMWFVAMGTDDFPYARPVSQSVASRTDLAGVHDLFLAEGILAAHGPVYELADPALVKSWKRLEDWVKEDLPFRRWHREFSSSANAWRVSRSASLLLDASPLQAAFDWSQRFSGRLTQLELEFLNASRRTARRRRWTAPFRKLVNAPLYQQAIIYTLIVACVFFVYRVVIRVQKMNAALTSSVNAKAQQDANPAYNSGLQKYNDGDYAGAIAEFSIALKYYPDHESALLKRGAAYRFHFDNRAPTDKAGKEADLRASLADLNRAVELNGGAEEYYERGWTYFDQDRYDLAAGDFGRALKIYPGYPEAHRGLGYVYSQQGRYVACEGEADAALKIRPGYDDAYYLQGLCEANMTQFEAAIKSLNKVIAISPAYADAFAELGWVYYQMKQYDKAIEMDREAIELYLASKKDMPNPHDVTGYALFQLGKYTAAIAEFRKAIELGSTNAKDLTDRIAEAEKKLKEQTNGTAGTAKGALPK